MTIYSVLLLFFLGTADYPFVETADQITVNDLSIMDNGQRELSLIELDKHYINIDNGSDPLLSSAIPGAEVDLECDFNGSGGAPDIEIEPIWFGERRQAAANDDEAGRSLNRRVEIVILRR